MSAGLEEACGEIIALRREVQRLVIVVWQQDRELDRWRHGVMIEGDYVCPRDLECDFWKRAAEQALRIWERAEDRADEMQALARRAARMAQAYISVCDEEDEEIDNNAAQVALWLEQTAPDYAPSVE